MAQNARREKVTDQDWYLVDTAIKAFISKYPKQYFAWVRQTDSELSAQDDWGRASKDNKNLRAANFRRTMTFPSIEKKDPITGEYTEDSLLVVLEKLLPGLTNNKSKGLAREFLRRYPQFSGSSKGYKSLSSENQWSRVNHI